MCIFSENSHSLVHIFFLQIGTNNIVKDTHLKHKAKSLSPGVKIEATKGHFWGPPDWQWNHW